MNEWNLPADRLVFHVDVNSAFLSWESVRRCREGLPDLRDIPACIGGNPKSRTGIVVAKSIPAKKYGITTGEPVAMALQKCPKLVVVPADFELYVRCSHAFKAICQEYTPVMESFSIDEVFLDMSGMQHIYPDPLKTACEMKDRIRRELGFTVNVGIGTNKLLAKMASDFEKPDKVHTLFPEEIPQKMWPLPLEELFSCGKASQSKLRRAGIKTIGDIAKADEREIRQLLGEKSGALLWKYANGVDESQVKERKEEAKGFSAETTVEEDLDSLEKIYHMLMAQTDVVAARMRAAGVKCGCVGITMRGLDFRNHSHQMKLSSPTDVTGVIYETACRLARESWKKEPLRLIGLSLTDIERNGYEQMSFLDQDQKERLHKLDCALDSIRSRYGDDSIRRAGLADTGKRINRRFQAEKKQR